ncbi:RluA family pseudouridine synthase [Nostoc ellipsosporum NOK]|jgi:23S rRNA pseudouridine1911/1915/1917 synthase|nr:RluA family pseudouridine synthase [Nostoc ellipsosporum NOK]
MIIFENDDLIACNKPSGLLSIPDREGKEISLKKQLQERYGDIFTVHRLDKDTSGLIIFARHAAAHKFLSQQFEARSTVKIYTGLVLGVPDPPSGQMNGKIAPHPVKPPLMVINRRGKDALTDYEVQESFGMYSLMQFRIHTGRTHQIRVHCKELGHPIVCDPLYGDGKPVFLSSFKSKFKLSRNVEEERPLMGRLALHANRLTITLPSGEEKQFIAELPKDFRATLQQLEKRMKK